MSNPLFGPDSVSVVQLPLLFAPWSVKPSGTKMVPNAVCTVLPPVVGPGELLGGLVGGEVGVGDWLGGSVGGLDGLELGCAVGSGGLGVLGPLLIIANTTAAPATSSTATT